MHRWEDIKHKYCPHGSRWPSERVYSRCSRCEEAAVVFGIIALGTWAAERAEAHRRDRFMQDMASADWSNYGDDEWMEVVRYPNGDPVFEDEEDR